MTDNQPTPAVWPTAHQAILAGQSPANPGVHPSTEFDDVVEALCFVLPAHREEVESLIRSVREAAWDEGERHEAEHLALWGQFCPSRHCNPYRTAVGDES